MRIVQLEPANVGNQGDHMYRTAQPLRAMCAYDEGVRAISGTWLSPAVRDAAEVADVLVLCKVAEPDLLGLLARRQAAGRATVYEINDDFTAVQPWNPTAGFFAQPENRSLVMQLAERCDGLQFSSGGLLEKFGGLQREPALFPNQLEQVAATAALSPTSAAQVTVGWGGSYGHREDLAGIVPPLLKVLRARPQVQLAIMGDRRLMPLFSAVPKDRLRFVKPGPLTAYTAFVEGLDIGIAPLADTAFNAGRSDVKYLEYAAHGVVPVMARAAAYRDSLRDGDTGFFFDRAEDLVGVLLRLVDDPDVRRGTAERAHRHVRAHRTQAGHAPRQLAWLRQLAAQAGKPQGDPPPPAAVPDAFDRLHRETPHRPSSDGDDGRYHAVELGRAEQHLYNALLSQGDPRRARQDCLAAAKAAPEDYLVAMHLARFEKPARAGERFKRAAALAGRSPAGGSTVLHVLWAAWAAERGDDATQGAQLETALARSPDYAPARVRLGILRETAGRDGEAEALYRRSLVDNPHYHVAALALATLLARLGRTGEAERVLSQAESTAQHDPRYWQLRGRIALVERRTEAAVGALERCLEGAGGAAGDAAQQAATLPLLAKAYALSGRTAEARALLSRLSRT